MMIILTMLMKTMLTMARLCKKRAPLNALDLERIAVLKGSGLWGSQDLERVAVLKRSGLWDPNIEEVASGSALLASATAQAAPAATGSSDDRLEQHEAGDGKEGKDSDNLLDDEELFTGAEVAEDAAEINKE